METKFTKKDSGKYIEVTYNSTTALKSYRLKYNTSLPCSNNEEADIYIKRAENIEKEILKVIADKKSSFDVNLIMITYMQVIESISSGLDVRSKLSDEELAIRFYDGYETRHNEAVAFCKRIRDMYEGGEHKETYTKHYKDYDKYNELIDEYHLDFKKLGDSDFTINLETLSKKTSDLLEMLKEMNADNLKKKMKDIDEGKDIL